MKSSHRTAIAALAGAGLLWGLTVPLSKLALAWLSPAWLTVARFAVTAPALAVVGRRGLREALDLRVALTGAIGVGAVVLLQNAGIARTSVSHAAVVIGAIPVLVALIAAARGTAVSGAGAWGGYALALAGVALVAGSGGGGATPLGDLLVLASAVLSAAMIVAQPGLLDGRDPAAVTAVQFAAGAVVALPVAAVTGGAGADASGGTFLLVFASLALAGTLLPFWLFAHGQSRVPAETAGVFMNLEPVVGAAIGWVAFGNATSPVQLAGALAVLAGIAVSTWAPGGPAGESRDGSAAESARAGSRAVAIYRAAVRGSVRIPLDRGAHLCAGPVAHPPATRFR